eukprot:4195651-Ditylum_brightwellii.AAC.1
MKRKGMDESNASSVAFKLDDDINKLSLRIDDVYANVYGKEKLKEKLRRVTQTLPEMLSSLEGELGLKQKEK